MRSSIFPDVRAIWLDSGWRDVRYALRSLKRSPRFTLTALVLLVLGIGSTTAIYSVSHAVLVRPLPYRDAERLVFLTEKGGSGVAWPNFEDWRRRASSFDGLASSLADAVLLTSGEIPRRFESRSVTSNFFQVLGVAPFRGRLFDESDGRADAARTVVVSHGFWVREFAGDRAAIGRTISLNRNPVTVIGVLPPEFRYMTPADVYILVEPQVAANYRGMQNRLTHTTLYAVGRLKPRISIDAARTEMRAIMAALAREYPDTNGGRDNPASDVQLVTLTDRVVADIAATLTVLSGAVTLLMIIACVNLAGLLLNRTAARRPELSIRAALGGSRWTLIRQLLVEQTLLVVAGGVLGALVGAVMLTGVISLAPRSLPRLDEIRLDVVVLALTTAVCCACAFMFGVIPAFVSSGVCGKQLVIRSGRASTPAASVLRRGLMIAEIAFATVLLSGSGLMVHTMVRLARVDPGFDPLNLHTVMFSLSGPAWPDARKQMFYDAVAERLRAMPGVENAAISYSLPILGSNWWSVFVIDGTTWERWISLGEVPNAGMVPVTAGYFETLRIPLVKGRYFDRTDTPDSLSVAIINRSVARKFWPNEDPIGKKIRQGFPAKPFGPWRTIVGVVGDIKHEGVDREAPPQMFLPIVQLPRTTVYAIVRSSRPLLASSIESAIHELDRTVPVFNERTVGWVMSEASGRRRIAMVVLSAFGAVAVLLAAIGLYGVIAQSVAGRRQEIGVRMALGATDRQIVQLFLRYGLVAVAIGIACGVAASVAVARSLASLVFGLSVTDPVTLGTVAALLTAVTLLASYIPARSATRLDPMTALRAE